MSTTKKLRLAFGILLFGVSIAAVVGWFMDKDPQQLGPVVMWISAAIAAGEASNIGKRATFKKEAHDAINA